MDITDEFIAEFHALLQKHQIEHSILLMPHELNDTGAVQILMSQVSPEQVWMICAELAKRFNDQRGPLNG